MIIKFSNLGAIKETELDLRPLTVIIGPNNTNKTYIAYSIYGLWQRMIYGNISGLTFNSEGEYAIILKINDAFIRRFIEHTTEKIELFKSELENFFQDSSSRLFSKTNFDLIISSQEIRSAIDRLVSLKAMPSFQEYPAVTLSYKNDILKIQIEKSRTYKSRLFRAQHYLLPQLKHRLFSRPFLLPAERNGFVLTYKELAYTRFKNSTEQTRRGSLGIGNDEMAERQPRYPQPIEDFLDFLVDLVLRQKTRIEPNEKTEFQLLADDIETHLQNKNKTVLSSTNFGGKEILINVKRGLSIDLYNASSSIKQLAPLLLYLRYRAAENDLLIIDEPEMGLHPESQAMLLEALGILVNLGVKVLLTTHSPYFMSHLNNLVSGDMENPDILKKQATSLYMKDRRSFLSMEQVSAYEMKNNKLCSLEDEDYGIRWDTLSDVSAEIQQKYFEIYEKREALSHGKKK